MKKLKDINWNHLYAFHEVAKVQSLKKGAKGIGLASSTLSEQLKKFEENLEVRLFIRSSKGLSLTQEGIKLFERSKVIFEEGNKLLEQFSDEIVGGYPVNIGIEETVSSDLSTEFASQYWDLYTKYGTVNTVREVGHEALVESLVRGNIDWGISTRPPRRKTIEHAEIGSFEIVFCCAKNLYQKFKDKKDILINIPFAESSWDKTLNKSIYKHMRKFNIVPKEKISSDHRGFVDKLCERGRCVMFIPQNPLANYTKLETFTLDEPIRISLYAIWKKGDESMISISTLQKLIESKITNLPIRYDDIDYQIEVSDVSKEKLN